MIRIHLIITILGFTFITEAQHTFSRKFDISVVNNATPLLRAWEGGLNYPIFSNVDYDNNGTSDLIAFDKSGKRIVVFTNEELKFMPFPSDLLLERWVLFRDYNCDGDPDIFTGTAGGIRVYRNTGNFNFVIEKNILQSKYPNFTSNLYVNNSDIPAIVDVDGDGDLDVLTFEINGTKVEWHRNYAKENSNNCNQLTFEMEEKCFGEFIENPSTSNLDLNQNCNTPKPPALYRRHAGSTITDLDVDYDGDIDLLISDISANNISFLNNGGTSSSAFMDGKDVNFPSYNTSINHYTFPYASYVDANGDQRNDLIICSTDENLGDNKSVHFYKNTGINKDSFELESTSFLIDQMIDFGAGAFPIAFDENADGLMDLLVGNMSLTENGVKTAKIALLRNTGTSTQPSFSIVTEDYLNLSTLQENYLFPAVADIDGDGDIDLFIGLSSGKIMHYTNSSGPLNPANFTLTTSNFESINDGLFAAPFFFDINQDGLVDLLIGKENGFISYRPNTGSTSTPDFSTMIPNYGGITTKDVDRGAFYGYPTPHVIKDQDTIRFLVGSEDGGIYYYKNKDQLLGGYIELTSKNYEGTKDGGRSALATYDWNNDGYLDMIVGNLSGGLAYYKGIQPNSISKITYHSSVKFQKNGSHLIVESNDFESIFIFNAIGQEVAHSTLKDINLLKLRTGIYYGVIVGKNQKTSFKFNW